MVKPETTPKKHQGTTVLRDNPDVDPVKVWREGFQPGPTLAEQLAADAEPVQDQEIPVPGHQETHQYGDDEPDDEALEPGDDPEPDTLTAPHVPEVTDVTGLEQFREPDPDEGGVIPLPQVEEIKPGPGVAEIVELARQSAVQRFGFAEVHAFAVCPNGHEIPGQVKFCPECGAPFQSLPAGDWTCQNGHLTGAAAKFCPECGDARPDLRAPVAGAGMAAELLARPAPEETLSAEEKAARAAQHAAALRMGAEDPGQVIQKPSGRRPTTLIHVRKSGWTCFGMVWMRGQEIELEEGSPRWQEAQDWIHLDEAGQTARWGRECFRLGPWPGQKSYAEAGPESYQKTGGGPPSLAALQQADAQEQARGRGVPAPMYAGGSFAGLRP